MVFKFEDEMSRNAKMKVVGVGGAGGNAVNRMIAEDLQGVEFIAINTDAQALKKIDSDLKIQIGEKLTRGLGAGARPEIGRQAIAESEDEVRQVLDGADLVFVTAGMGGGTGTGAAPTVGRIAREQGALAIAIVTKPFRFEGKKRMKHAEIGLKELRRTVDTMIMVPNERLLSVVGADTTFRDALKKADEVLLHATQGISDLISVTGEVNVDFADVRTVMSNRGAALMGTGTSREEDRAVDAAQQAISSPLLGDISINGADGVLVNISGGPDLTIDEVTTINSIVQEAAGDAAEMIFGAVQDEALSDTVRVTVIATGFGAEDEDDEPAGGEGAVASGEKVIQADFRGPELVRGEDRSASGSSSDRSATGASGDATPGEAGVRASASKEGRGRGDTGGAEGRENGKEDLEIPTFIRRQMD